MISKISRFLVFLFIPLYIYPQSDIKVISSDSKSIIIEYTPSYIDSSDFTFNNETYKRVTFKLGSVLDHQPGMPDAPVRTLTLGVPEEFGNTINVINSSYKMLKGKLIPQPTPSKNKDGLTDYSYVTSPEYNNFSEEGELVYFGEFGSVRGLPVQSFIINPVYFDAPANSIKLYTKIVFRINYAPSNVVNAKPIKDDLIKDIVINFDVAQRWHKSETKRLDKSLLVNSVLANGTWYKFEAEKEGIYKITYQMLASYGIDPAAVDPKTIKIYNNGGKTLPERPSEVVPTDLVENAIIVVGEEDNRFDQGDYILFYGRGTDFWYTTPGVSQIKRASHPYSLKNYFWITSGGSQGKRMADKSSVQSAADVVQQSTPAFKYLQEELISLVKSGRNFFGEEFDQTNRSRTYMNLLDGFIAGSKIDYKGQFVNSEMNNVLFSVEEHSTTVYSGNLLGRKNQAWSQFSTGYLNTFSGSFTGTLPESRSLLKITYNATQPASKGYLDYYEIYYSRNLSAAGNELLFYSYDTTGVIEYPLNGFTSSDIYVFDVSDFSSVKKITNPSVWSGSEFKFRASEISGNISKYIAVEKSAMLTPANPQPVQNSNVLGINPGAKLVIIANKEFQTQAEQFKQYKENEVPLPISTVIVYQDEIFNEFSGGLPDPSALRNFIKYAYENWQVEPEYVLFFGDGTYDYKNIEGGNQNKNLIITFQTIESLHEVNSSTYDDYFVRVTTNDDSFPDLAIGRLPIQTTKDAEIILSKIKEYETGYNVGSWRNKITFVADDAIGENWEGDLHSGPSESVSRTVPQSYEFNKIFLSAYPIVITSSGKRIPTANTDIINAMNEGTIIVNYVGHGNPRVWAHEQVFDKDISIPQLNNSNYFFLTAATCDFGDFDKPSLQSGAEELFLKESGGSIGSFTASRLVFAGENISLMYKLFDKMFDTPRDTLNYMIPLGKIIMFTKVDKHSGTNDQKYHLLGDPTLRLNVPRFSAKIDSINGKTPDALTNIKALSNVNIKGHILTRSGGSWNDFNGEGILSVYDSQREFTLKQDNDSLHQVSMQGGQIFRGRISVTNGEYDASFVVPKDISYENQRGKIVLYFTGENTDGVGYSNSFTVGGTDTNAVNDNSGPSIEIYFDDINSTAAYLANPNSKLIVKLQDESGLNTTGTGIGHKLEGILNEDKNNPIDFTEYFLGDINAGGKSGKVEYKFNGLDLGEYKIEIKAWDVFNNFTTETAYFNVVSGDNLVIRDVYNYPNPFKSNTTFTFQQNLNRMIDVKIKVYSVAGRLIKNIERLSLNDKFVAIDWDGRDEDGNLIANGTYLYKVIVKTTDSQYSESVLGKLAVIR